MERGPDLAWSQPSRFGAPGMAARWLLRRILRPYALRQAELDEALAAAAIETDDVCRDLALFERLARSADLAIPIEMTDVLQADTAAGHLLVHRRDQAITPWLVAHGVWEPDLTAWLKRTLGPGMTFIDVGANIGYFSVLASRLVGESGRVVAVEPEETNVRMIRANLWRNHCRNAIVMPVAAYTDTGHVALLVEKDATAFSRIQVGAEKGTLVPCARLDDLLAGLRPDVVKIDAEGSDRLVLEGALELLEGAPAAWVVVEILAHLHPEEDVHAYRDLGFELYLLGDDGSAAPVPPEEVIRAATSVTHMSILLRRS